MHVHKLDVTCTESVNDFSDWTKSTAGRVDVLVNNAGGAHGVDRVEDGKDADWENGELKGRIDTAACKQMGVKNKGRAYQISLGVEKGAESRTCLSL